MLLHNKDAYLSKESIKYLSIGASRVPEGHVLLYGMKVENRDKSILLVLAILAILAMC